jgi:hypothetical protein
VLIEEDTEEARLSAEKQREYSERVERQRLADLAGHRLQVLFIVFGLILEMSNSNSYFLSIPDRFLMNTNALTVSNHFMMRALSSLITSPNSLLPQSEKMESCSCIEGNPCVQSYNCKDWKNRFDVAKAHGWKGHS